MNWKRFTAVAISIVTLVLGEQLLHACSDFDPYDTYPSFFGNKGPEKPAYRPFFFVEGDLYYNDYWYGNEENMAQFNRRAQVKEWQGFSDQSIPLADIDSLVFPSTLPEMQQIEKAVSDGSLAALPPNYRENGFAQWLVTKRRADVITYLSYAKSCESNTGTPYDEWEAPEKKPVLSNAALKTRGLDLIKKEKDDFLRMKYAFQVLRMAFYSKDYNEVLKLYDQLIPKNPTRSIAYTRSLGFKAGAHFRKNQRALAGYLYSKMFDSHDAYKYEAMISYTWSRQKYNEGELVKDFDPEIYALCKNDHERAVVNVMNALRHYDQALPLIKKAYALDPSVVGIDVLMNREINKAESRYFYNEVYDQNQLEYPKNYSYGYAIRNYDYLENQFQRDSLRNTYVQYVNELKQFNEQIIADGKNGSKAYWHLSNAYMNYLLQDNSAMRQDLAKANTLPMEVGERGLSEMIDLLSFLRTKPKLDAAAESELLPKLRALNNLAMQDYSASKNFRDIMTHLIAGKYLRQGDTVKAIYAMGHAEAEDQPRKNFSASNTYSDLQGNLLDIMPIASLNKVQQFAENSGKTSFEQWLVNGTFYTPSVLKELEGTKYLRERNFKKAEQILSGIPDLALYVNPFNESVEDYIKPKKSDSVKLFTKYAYAQRMRQLQEAIAKNNHNADALYEYAVALYNTSYYGKACNIFQYFRSHVDPYAYYKDASWDQLPRAYQEYYGLYSAEQYFNKAYLAASTPQLKAKALWGAAKCWQKRCTSIPEDRYYASDLYFIHALQSPYYPKIRQMSGTAYYQDIVNNCSYFRDYLTR